MHPAAVNARAAPPAHPRRPAPAVSGATLRYLPKYSPDLNPIEMPFSKLKADLRKAAERTIPRLRRRIGRFARTLTGAKRQIIQARRLCVKSRGICCSYSYRTRQTDLSRHPVYELSCRLRSEECCQPQSHR
jgi:DDE superfamily endonuclease